MEKFESAPSGEIKEAKFEEISVEQTRTAYAEAYVKYREFFADVKEKDLADFEKTIEPSRKYIEAGDTEKLKSNEIAVVDRKHRFVEELMERGINIQAAEKIYDVELRKAEYEAARIAAGKKMLEQGAGQAEVFQKLVLRERELLNQAKVESWPPVEKNIFRKGMEWWLKQGTATRLIVSTALVTGVVALAGGFGAAAAGLYAGHRFARGASSVFFAKLAGKGVDMVLSKGIIAKKEAALDQLKQGFNLEKLKDTEKELEKIFEENAKREHRKLLIKAGVTVVAGAGAALGLNMLEQSLFGGAEGVPEEEVSEETSEETPEETPEGTEEPSTEETTETETPETEPTGEPNERIIEAGSKASKPLAATEVSRQSPATAEEIAAVQEMRAGVIPEQLKIATVGKGEGIEHALIRQLKLEPAKFGFDGDVDDAAAVGKWAGGQAHRIAIENGYIRPDGAEVRVLDLGEGKNPAYLLDQDAGGKFHVREFLEGLPSGGGTPSPYEYEWKPPKVTPETETPATAAPVEIEEMPPAKAHYDVMEETPRPKAEPEIEKPAEKIPAKEAIEPNAIEVQGGSLKFVYDADGNPVKMASSFELKGVSGGEYFNDHFREMVPPEDIDKLTLYGRQLNAYIKIYEQLKAGGHGKEAEFVLTAMKKMLGEIDKNYLDKTVVDYEKLPDYLHKK